MILLLLLFVLTPSLSSPLSVSWYLSQDVADAFTASLAGCTAIVLSERWMLSVAHCFVTINELATLPTNELGDFVMSKDVSPMYVLEKKKGARSGIRQGLWAKEISEVESKLVPAGVRQWWRPVEKIIVNGNFLGEALSWKGADLALLYLGDTTYGNPPGVVAPICLPKVNINWDDPDSKVFVSGYGRRKVPHCLTDHRGPEAFETCGRPRACSHHHRTRRCGLQFLYKGRLHSECLLSPTPSAADPACLELRKALPELEDSDRTIHILDDATGELLAKCYPKQLPDSPGWCTTRPPGVDDNTEPGYSSGWGFCSSDPSQSKCTEAIVDFGEDTHAMPVDILDVEYCEDKLGDNLRVEQPEVRREEYEDLRDRWSLVCIGRNHSYEGKEDLFVVKKSTSDYYALLDKQKARLIGEELAERTHHVNGGPSCLGDSGGPLFALVDSGNKSVPVLLGVFSFLLWGTCQGRAEPAYYGRVDRGLPWILRYVAQEDLCWHPA